MSRKTRGVVFVVIAVAAGVLDTPVPFSGDVGGRHLLAPWGQRVQQSGESL
jgi:hypothetical protein